MNEVQIAIEATKEAIKDLVLFANPFLAEQVDLITEEEIRPYMSSETRGCEDCQYGVYSKCDPTGIIGKSDK